MSYIKAGTGVHVDYDFTRLMVDTPIEIDAQATAASKRHEVYGWIAGDMNHPRGFMRRLKVRVCTDKQYVVANA